MDEQLESKKGQVGG
ncbi:unknown protein [Parachlamydia acanthamoebae UV-7]|uniref:Uncharacterized protein n=1 Tax=Parachlamydia acanthamoebae (strain UV7) TaxID=765952 RepID=F8KW52_PARAV|nr:unknown protein [Parachlamydia acanthamoebae UV-7]